MKQFIIITLALVAFSTANAQAHKATDTAKKAKPGHKADAHKAADKHSTTAATDDSANYVGTNDFYLALIREGVRKG